MSTTFSTTEHVLGALAILLTMIALFPYTRDTLTRRIRPHRASWLVWAVLATLSASAQNAAGSGPALWFATCQAGGTLLVAALALRSGRGNLATATEILVLGLAGFGLLIWQLTSEPAYALAMSISVSACAAIPTVLKAYAEPMTETLAPWALKLGGSLCAIGATTKAGAVMLAYPVYLALLYVTVLGALALGHRRARIPVASQP